MEAYDAERCLVEGDEALRAVMSFVRESAARLEAHEAEKGIFRLMMAIGVAGMKLYFAERGTGDIGEVIKREDGVTFRRKSGLRERDYFSIFGKFDVPRTCYRTPGEPGVYPLDGQVNLPKRCYSYFMQEWMTLFAVEHPFKESSSLFEQLLELHIAESVLIDVAKEASRDFEDFYEEKSPPERDTEGEILAAGFDGKGVPMIKKEAAKLKAKLGKGEKRQKKKESVVGVCYTVDRKERTPEELAESIVEPEAARERRKKLGEREEHPRAKNIRRVASLKRTKSEVMEIIRQDAERRDTEHQRPLVILMDGDLNLWWRAIKAFKAWEDTYYVLDIIHVVGYLWDAANALFKEGSPEGRCWVKSKLTEILRGRVGYVIGGLKQSAARQDLTNAQRGTLGVAIGYFHRRKQWMQYDKYLQMGLPVASGLVESACGSLVKHRMEGQGKRWGIPGAEAILTLRSLKKSNDNDLPEYGRFRAQQERGRLYGNLPRYAPVEGLAMAA